MTRLTTHAAVAMAATMLSVPAALAGEGGDFRMVRTFVQDYTTFDHADGQVTGGALEGVATIIESSGGLFTQGTHRRITCMVYAHRPEQGLDMVAPCVVIVPSGDMWFTNSLRQSGDIETAGSGGGGTMEIVGGTGAYEGISGTCSYETSYLPDDWLAGIADCTWERP